MHGIKKRTNPAKNRHNHSIEESRGSRSQKRDRRERLDNVRMRERQQYA